MLVMANPLGAKGVAAEAAIARLCLEGLPALELFERAAVPPVSYTHLTLPTICSV